LLFLLLQISNLFFILATTNICCLVPLVRPETEQI
jgi:hypothetical protein